MKTSPIRAAQDRRVAPRVSLPGASFFLTIRRFRSYGRIMQLVFGDHALDVDRRELTRGAKAVVLRPQVFDLLLYLIRNRHRVVSKDDLIATVWGGRIVSDSALTTRINAVRHAVGDDGAAQRLIRTVPRKGIRFVAEVSERGETREMPLLPPAAA